MNFFIAKVKTIEKLEELTVVTLFIQNQSLQIITLEISSRLKIGSMVTLEVKSSSVILAPLFSGVKSSANQLKCCVKNITYGKLLCVVEVNLEGCTIESMALQESIKKMNFKKDDTILVLINPTELSIGKIYD